MAGLIAWVGILAVILLRVLFTRLGEVREFMANSTDLG
jgi:hypothetical protein